MLTAILGATILITPPKPKPITRDQRMGWWRKARFGMFIHWGLYSIPAGEYGGKNDYGEWLMESAHVPVHEYEKYQEQFN
ncbi:MAG: alpha-L-fucosidase, partial [bacterium]